MSNYHSYTAASFSTSLAAAIDESSSSNEEEVSDNLESMTDNEADNNDDDDDIESIFCHDAHVIQNRTSRAIRTVAMEDRCFQELFGASIGVVLHVWNAMEGGGLLPEKSRPMHLLWTLYFLKV